MTNFGQTRYGFRNDRIIRFSVRCGFRRDYHLVTRVTVRNENVRRRLCASVRAMNTISSIRWSFRVLVWDGRSGLVRTSVAYVRASGERRLAKPYERDDFLIFSRTLVRVAATPSGGNLGPRRPSRRRKPCRGRVVFVFWRISMKENGFYNLI